MQQPTNPMKKETYHDRCLFEVPVLNEDGTEKDSDYWLFCLKNKPCPIHSSMQKEETENEIKIKNFHCSEHGDIKPIATPECPKCISMQKEEWEDNLSKCLEYEIGGNYYLNWDKTISFLSTQISLAKSQERQRIVEKVKGMQTGWYDAGEGLDVEFSAQEMKDDIIKALTQKE